MTTRIVDLGADVVELVACPVTPSAPLREVAFRGNAWLPAELATLREMFVSDHDFGEIAARLGRGAAGVSTKAYELGLRRNTVRAWSDLEDEELARRYGTEATATIAGIFGRSAAAIYARAGVLGLTEGNPPAWTAWEDAQLRAGYEQAIPIQQIATLVGRPFGGVIGRAGLLGLRHPRKPADWSDAEAARALELANEGHRYLRIIEALAGEGYPRRSKIGFGLKLRAMGYGRGWGRAWLPDEDELLRRAYVDGASLTPLRDRLGRTQSSLRWRAEYLGLRGSHPNRDGWRGEVWSDADVAFLKANFGKMRSPELARRLGRTKGAMFCRANLLGLVHGYIRPFSDMERDAIAKAWANGLSLAQLGGALDRRVSALSKYTTRYGPRFNDPCRPVRPTKGASKGKRAFTLAEILALPDQENRA